MARIFGTHDERTVAQLQRCVEAEAGAVAVLCADGHVGYSMPIGGVVAYRDHVSPSGVGYDIACGNMAVRTTIRATDLTRSEYERIADEIARRVSFGVGRVNDERVDDPVIDQIAQSPVPQQRALAQMAAAQLGTVGSGNHYVDLLEDEDRWLWIGVHFGSRGLGHKTATGFMQIAQGRAWGDGRAEGEMDAPPLLLRTDMPSGQDYVSAMNIAGAYAYAGREAVVRLVLQILGGSATDSVHNHHNFAWRETHNGDSFWVVRKGATPAFPGQRGFVGGSMGDISVVLEGVDGSMAREALYSTVHGAGRVMSRTQAAGKQRWTKARWSCGNHRACSFSAPAAEFERGPGGELPKCPTCGSKLRRMNSRMERLGGGLVDFPAVQRELDSRGIVLRGAGADEAPQVYRQLETVLAAHAESVRIVHTLQPRVVVMASSEEFDPFKD